MHRRRRPPLPEPRRRRVHRRAPGGRGARQRLPAVVLERASRRRLQVAPRDRRLRARTARDPSRSPAATPSAGRRRDLLPEHDRGDQPPRVPVAALAPTDVVVTTVVEHHANLLPVGARQPAPIRRVRRLDGTFTVDDVIAALDETPRPKLLAITGASNVTGWMPPIDEIVARRARAWRARLPRRRPARAAPPAPDAGRLRGVERPQDVRAVRSGCARRPAPERSPKATRSSPAAARSTSWTSTRSSGPSHPNAKRPVRRTCSAAIAMHAAHRRVRRDRMGRHRRARPRARAPATRRVWRRLPGVNAARARGSTSPRCRWRRSRSRECTTRSSRRD